MNSSEKELKMGVEILRHSSFGVGKYPEEQCPHSLLKAVCVVASKIKQNEAWSVKNAFS
jgi:hypothetical protein